MAWAGKRAHRPHGGATGCAHTTLHRRYRKLLLRTAGARAIVVRRNRAGTYIANGGAFRAAHRSCPGRARPHLHASQAHCRTWRGAHAAPVFIFRVIIFYQ